MSEFTDEVAEQIGAGINRLGNGKYTFYSIYPLPPDTKYDDTVSPTEWIQATGTAPDRVTVEIKQSDADGVHRLYTVGRPTHLADTAQTEPIQNGDHTYLVQPNEVLSAVEAIELFLRYHDTHSVPPEWELREQAEFADTREPLNPGSDAGRSPS